MVIDEKFIAGPDNSEFKFPKSETKKSAPEDQNRNLENEKATIDATSKETIPALPAIKHIAKTIGADPEAASSIFMAAKVEGEEGSQSLDADSQHEKPSLIRWFTQSPKLKKFLMGVVGVFTVDKIIAGGVRAYESFVDYQKSVAVLAEATKGVSDIGYDRPIHPLSKDDAIQTADTAGENMEVSRGELEVAADTGISNWLATNIDARGGNSLKNSIDTNPLLATNVPYEFVVSGMENADRDYEAALSKLNKIFGSEAKKFSSINLLRHAESRLGDTEEQILKGAITETFGDSSNLIIEKIESSGASANDIWQMCQDLEQAVGAQKQFTEYINAGQVDGKVKGYNASGVIDFYGKEAKFNQSTYDLISVLEGLPVGGAEIRGEMMHGNTENPGIITVEHVSGGTSVHLISELNVPTWGEDRSKIQQNVYKFAEDFTRDVIIDLDLTHADQKTVTEISGAVSDVLHDQAILTATEKNMVSAYAVMQRNGYDPTYSKLASDLEEANMNADLALVKLKAVVGDNHPDLVHQLEALVDHNDSSTDKILSIGSQFGMPTAGG